MQVEGKEQGPIARQEQRSCASCVGSVVVNALLVAGVALGLFILIAAMVGGVSAVAVSAGLYAPGVLFLAIPLIGAGATLATICMVGLVHRCSVSLGRSRVP